MFLCQCSWDDVKTRSSHQKQEFPRELDDLITKENWRFTQQDAGWISKQGFEGWVDNIFLPHINSTRENKEDPVLLVMDGHSSRSQADVMQKLRENDVHVLIIPAHTSHILQPLDRGVNKAFKAALNRYKNDFIIPEEGAAEFRYYMLCLAKAAFYDASNSVVLKRAWKASGLNPLDPDMVLNNHTLVNSLPPPNKPARDAISLGSTFATTPEKINRMYEEKKVKDEKRRARLLKAKVKQSQKRGPKLKLTRPTPKTKQLRVT